MAKKPTKKQSKKKSKKKLTALPKTGFWQDSNALMAIGIILLVTIIAFSTSINNEFVNWDDDVNLLENPNMQAFDWENIKGIFTDDVIGNYLGY